MERDNIPLDWKTEYSKNVNYSQLKVYESNPRKILMRFFWGEEPMDHDFKIYLEK